MEGEGSPSGIAHDLLQAAREGKLDSVKEIIRQQSKEIINCFNEIGQTPLHLASRYVPHEL